MTDLLRDGDPAREHPLSEADRLAMRREVLRRSRKTLWDRFSTWSDRAALALAAAALVLVGAWAVALLAGPGSEPARPATVERTPHPRPGGSDVSPGLGTELADVTPPGPAAEESGPGSPSSGEPDPGPAIPSAPGAELVSAPSSPSIRETRIVRFATDGGTRIVWVLDPDFDLDTDNQGASS